MDQFTWIRDLFMWNIAMAMLFLRAQLEHLKHLVSLCQHVPEGPSYLVSKPRQKEQLHLRVWSQPGLQSSQRLL